MTMSDSETLLFDTSFELDCLNTTLKFVKDDSKLMLYYPEMITEQANFIVNIFERDSNIEADIACGYSTMYTPLWEALKIFGLKYKFTLRRTEPKNPEMERLVLDKIPITSKSNIDNQDPHTSTPALSFITDSNIKQNNTQINTTNNESESNNLSAQMYEEEIVETSSVSKLVNLLSRFTKEYYTEMFKKLHHFVCTDISATTLVIENLNPCEMIIHFNWRVIATKVKRERCFNEEGWSYASRLLEVLEKSKFKLTNSTDKGTGGLSNDQIGDIPKNKKSKRLIQNLIYKKVPLIPDRRKDLIKLDCKKNKLNALMKRPNVTSLGSRAPSFEIIKADPVVTKSDTLVAKSDTAVTKSDTFVTKSDLQATKSDTVVTKSDTQVTKSDIVVTKSDTQVTKSDTQVIKSGTVSNEMGNATKQQQAVNPTDKIKMKLIEGLNQPVNSDKAMKMMLNMGWSGGGLGVRGEGITEPIAPGIKQYLDTRKRVGLGGLEVAATAQPQPQPSQQKTKTTKATDLPKIMNYHTHSLEVILELLTNPPMFQNIYLPQNKYRHESRFIKHLLINFNNGYRLQFCNRRQTQLVKEIEEIMASKCWELSADSHVDIGLIILTKTAIAESPTNKIETDTSINSNSQSMIQHKMDKEIPPKPVPLQPEKNPFKNFTNLNESRKNNNDSLVNPFETAILKPLLNYTIESNSCSNDCSINNQNNSIKKPIEKCNNSCVSHSTIPFDFKNNFLGHILLFCKEDVTQKTVNLFSYNINKNEKLYIMETICAVNEGSKWNGSPLEQRIHEKIHEAMMGYTIECDFSSAHEINLQKQYNFKTNSRTDNEKSNHNNNDENDNCSQVTNINGQEDKFVFIGGVKYNSIEDFEAFLSVKTSSNHATENNTITTNIKIENLFEKTLKIRCGNDDNDSINIENEQVTNNSSQDKCNSDPVVKNSDQGINNSEQVTEIKEITMTNDEDDKVMTNNNSQDMSNSNPVVKNSDQDINNSEYVNTEINEIFMSDDEDYIVCSDDEIIENDQAMESQKLADFISEQDSVTTEINAASNDLNNKKDLTLKEILNLPILSKIPKVPRENDQKDSNPSKRSRFDSEVSIQQPKKQKYYVKKIAIVPKIYPTEKITEKTALEIQILIRDSIDCIDSSELPLLKCNCLQDGVLLYSCYSEKSFIFFEDLLKNTDFKILYGIKKVKSNTILMTLRINSYFIENTQLTLERLVKYNAGLSIVNWKIVKRLFSKDFNVFLIKMDEDSYNYIRDANFSLFAGIDKVLFSHYWDWCTHDNKT